MRIFPIVIITTLFCASSIAMSAPGSVRTITIQGDRIIPIHTALGYSTVILLPEAAESVIVGDQDRFKIEFFREHLAIKPLQPGGESNLMIITPKDRFYCLLRIGSAQAVDQLIKFERKETHLAKRVELTKQSGNILFSIDQIARERNLDWITLRFSLLNMGNDPIELLPDQIELRNGKRLILIDTLYLQMANLQKQQRAYGFMRLRADRFSLGRGFLLKIPCKEQSPISISLEAKELI